MLFDPKYWRFCNRITAKRFCNHLQEHTPPDAIMNVCGDDRTNMYMEVVGSVFPVDDYSLSDLSEYEKYAEPEKLEIGECNEQTVWVLQDFHREAEH